MNGDGDSNKKDGSHERFFDDEKKKAGLLRLRESLD